MIQGSLQNTSKLSVLLVTLRTLRRHCTSMADTVHATAIEGFQSGTFYDQFRPSYTEALVKHVVSSLHTGPVEGSKYQLLELGAGTGKFTRQILKHLGNDVSFVATEPSEGFLTVLQKQSPGLDTLKCSAVEIPLPDNSVQNIVCAQSFHWFASPESLTEICRVLTPQGRFMCVWNIKDIEKFPWSRDMEKILSKYYTSDTPRAITRQWRGVVDSFPKLKFVEESVLDGIKGMQGNKSYIVDHYSSISVIAKLPEEEKKAAQQEFLEALGRHFTEDQVIHIPFISLFFCAEKV